MKVEVKSLISFGESANLANFRPMDPTKFGIWIDFTVGPTETEGGHDFRILVCTPKWILEEYGAAGGVFARNMLIVFEYNFDTITRMIREFVESCGGDDDFMKIAMKIGRVAAWEFEDYQKHAP